MSRPARILARPTGQSAGYDLVGRLVEQMGRTGKKIGKGFYDYGDNGDRQLWPGLAQATGGKVNGLDT